MVPDKGKSFWAGKNRFWGGEMIPGREKSLLTGKIKYL
jgi:hypothetical protein